MTSYLPPIEKPRGLRLKLIYFFSRRQAGQVITPITTFAARMPFPFLTLDGKVSRLDKKLKLPPRPPRCSSASRSRALEHVPSALDASQRYAATRNAGRQHGQVRRTTAVPDQPAVHRRRARRARRRHRTDRRARRSRRIRSPAPLRRHDDERQICDIVWLVASEHLYNMTNIGLGIELGWPVPGTRRAQLRDHHQLRRRSHASPGHRGQRGHRQPAAAPAGRPGARGDRQFPLGRARPAGCARSAPSPSRSTCSTPRAVHAAVPAARPEAIVCQATALAGAGFSRSLDRTFALTNRLRTEGTDNLLAAAREAGRRRIVAQSFASNRYPREGGPVKREDNPLAPARRPAPADRRRDGPLDQAVIAAGGIALRYGGFYGGRDRMWSRCEGASSRSSATAAASVVRPPGRRRRRHRARA